MVDTRDSIEEVLQADYPDKHEEWTERQSQDIDFTESSGFQQSSRLYNILVPEADRKIVANPDEVANPADVDVVMHMGCHVVKTPHIIDATVDLMEELGYTMVPLGGYANCCGIQQLMVGDFEGAERVDSNRFENAAALDPDYFLTECTSCYATTSAFSEKLRSPDFEIQSLVDFLLERESAVLDAVTRDDEVSVAVHDHFDAFGMTSLDQARNARKLFSMLPGISIVEMEHSLETGLRCNYRTDPAEFGFEDLSRTIFREASDAGADVLVDFWHACHRHLVSYDPEYDVAPTNYTTLIANRMGYEYEDKSKKYKRWGMTGQLDKIVEHARPVFEANGVDEAEAREIAKVVFTNALEDRAKAD